MSNEEDLTEFNGNGVNIKRMEPAERARPIAWGDEYLSWDIERRLGYAEKLASSMNHAADVMQKERNELLKIAKHQEAQLEDNKERYKALGHLMHQELQNAGAREQNALQDIVALTMQVEELKKQVSILERKLEKLGGNHGRLGD